MKDLEETKKEILDFINQKGFNIFYGLIQDIRDTVLWNPSQGNWKDFINISENEGIKTLIYSELMLSEELAELSEAINQCQINRDEKEDVQRLKELRSKLKSFEKYSKNIAYIHLSWIKEGVRYLLQLASPWYDEFQEVYQEAQNFLKEKEAISLEEEKASLKETKEKLSLLSTQILEWAKSEGLNRVTKGQVQVYLLENEIVLGWTEREMLYTMVNKELAKSLR